MPGTRPGMTALVIEVGGAQERIALPNCYLLEATRKT
jgi:hypothetical protein